MTDGDWQLWAEEPFRNIQAVVTGKTLALSFARLPPDSSSCADELGGQRDAVSPIEAYVALESTRQAAQAA